MYIRQTEIKEGLHGPQELDPVGVLFLTSKQGFACSFSWREREWKEERKIRLYVKLGLTIIEYHSACPSSYSRFAATLSVRVVCKFESGCNKVNDLSCMKITAYTHRHSNSSYRIPQLRKSVERSISMHKSACIKGWCMFFFVYKKCTDEASETLFYSFFSQSEDSIRQDGRITSNRPRPGKKCLNKQTNVCTLIRINFRVLRTCMCMCVPLCV